MHTARVVQREGACPERPRHRAWGFRGRLLHAPGHPGTRLWWGQGSEGEGGRPGVFVVHAGACYDLALLPASIPRARAFLFSYSVSVFVLACDQVLLKVGRRLALTGSVTTLLCIRPSPRQAFVAAPAARQSAWRRARVIASAVCLTQIHAWRPLHEVAIPIKYEDVARFAEAT